MDLRSVKAPAWLKKRLSSNRNIYEVKRILSENSVRTVCESSLCPNLTECFSKRSVTFLILGDACTRSCGFCSVNPSAGSGLTLSKAFGKLKPRRRVNKARPAAIDPDEALKVLEAVRRLESKYVIITSVTRDDLADGGADQFAGVIRGLKKFSKTLIVEVLVPDFKGDENAVKMVIDAGADIFAHNIETVRRLYPIARHGASYERSLAVLRCAKCLSAKVITKSGMMVGLGETEDEIIDAMRDLRGAGCEALTIGQYLRPGEDKVPVQRFAGLEEFARYEKIGEEIGFYHVASGPFVRSSYFAEEGYYKIKGDAMTNVMLPPLAEGIDKANISYWHHGVGDAVSEGENLVELVTDKATFNMPAPASGVLRQILAAEGDEIKVGQVIARIE